jgi:hypothetical protein
VIALWSFRAVGEENLSPRPEFGGDAARVCLPAGREVGIEVGAKRESRRRTPWGGGQGLHERWG